MSGYSETEFKPGDNVRNYDALVSISRMVNREKDINLEQLEEKYQAAVLDKFNVPSYARKAVALCLEKGIIKDSDVSAYSSNPYVPGSRRYTGTWSCLRCCSRQFNASAALPLRIPCLLLQYKAYVSYLMEIGVISETTDNFNPNSYINRETYAKMLDIASDAYEKKELGEDITGKRKSGNNMD